MRGNDMKIGFLNLLTIIFVIFKLNGTIDWNWLLVFIPTILNILIFPVTKIVGIAFSEAMKEAIEKHGK